MCEMGRYCDLFKDFIEVEFRTLTIAVLNKLPLDDPEKDIIMKHVNSLEFQAEQSERFYSPGAQFSLSNVKNEPQPHIKQEQVSADMNQDSGLDLEDDNNDEVQVLSVKIHKGEPSSSIIAQDQQQQEESAAAANYDHGDRSVLSNSIEAVEGESVLESPEDYCEASNQSLVNNANTVEEAGQSPMKRKDESQFTTAEVSEPKQRCFSTDNFWTEFAKFISNEQQSTQINNNKCSSKNLFSQKVWTPLAKDALKIPAFINMTEAKISSFYLKKKKIRISQLVQKRKVPDELCALAEKCHGLTNISYVELGEILPFIFTVATNLKVLTFSFDSLEDLNVLLDSLIGIPQKNLKKLHLAWNSSSTSSSPSVAITQAELHKLSVLALEHNYLHGIEILILDADIHIDNNSNHHQSLNLLLHRLNDSLQEFKITKNFIGIPSSSTSQYEIIFHKMQALKVIDISSKYEICTLEAKELPEIIDIECDDDIEKQETDLKDKLVDIPVLVNFTIGHKYEKLERIRLGSKIDINLLNLQENFPALETFVVGSQWNLRNIFGNNADKQIKLKYIQFPDALADPHIFQQVKTMCPDLTRVKLQLPTVGCLQEFFNVFGNTKIERLSLSFDYVFEAGFNCPLVGIPFKLTSEKDLIKMAKLEKYSGWTNFVKLNKIDIPDQDEDEIAELGVDKTAPATGGQQNYFGLANLTSLKRLTLKHHSRKLNYPKDHGNNSSRDEMLSFDLFPLGKEFYGELIKIVDVLREFRVPDTLFKRDPKAEKHFYKVTGWNKDFTEPKPRPNYISSNSVISRRTKVKNEQDGGC